LSFGSWFQPSGEREWPNGQRQFAER
jgi:hypothetical protein